MTQESWYAIKQQKQTNQPGYLVSQQSYEKFFCYGNTRHYSAYGIHTVWIYLISNQVRFDMESFYSGVAFAKIETHAQPLQRDKNPPPTSVLIWH